MKAFNEYNQDFTSKYGERDTIEKEIKFQTGMQNVEMKSINEIKRLRLFEGIAEDEFQAQANHVTLKPHFTDFWASARN